MILGMFMFALSKVEGLLGNTFYFSEVFTTKSGQVSKSSMFIHHIL